MLVARDSRLYCAIFLMVALNSLCAGGQPVTQTSALSASEIVRLMAARNLQRAADLGGYRSTRVYQLDYDGYSGKHATMTANVSFESGKKTFTIVSEDGSKLLLNRVLHRLLETEQEAADRENLDKTALSEENYQFELLGNEPVNGRPCYILRVKPKRGDKFLYDGRIWVDAQDYAVARIEAQPAKNPSFWTSQTTVEHEYVKLGEFWLPASNRSSSKIRLGGRAILTIDYGNYEVMSKQDSREARSRAEAY